MSGIKMVGLDLDGTLLNDKKEVTAYTRDVLFRALAAGVVVLAATGRPSTGIPEELRAIPGMRYAVTANGGRILDLQYNKLLYEKLVPYEEAVRVVKIFDEYDTLREIYFDGQGYVQADELAEIDRYIPSKPMADYIRNTRRVVPDLWEKIRVMDGHGMDKVHALFADDGEQKEAMKRIKACADALSISSSLGRNLEINAKGVNKGVGLIRLGELLGIKPEEIMACGDGSNDLEMICMAGIGVAMKNGTSEVKAAADYITESNEEDGAARAIEKFVLDKVIPEDVFHRIK
ncbi:MAG: Cof-type HAD-IIB family hydrolase [Bariatricus sp.]